MKTWLIAAALLFPSASMACAPFQEVVGFLETEFQEQLLFTGLDDRGYVVSLFVNPDTRSFSYLHINAEGVACLINFGNVYEQFEVRNGEPL